MKHVTIPVTHFEQNCSIVWCESSLKCAFIDPGGDVNKLIDKVSELALKPEKIILTHGHLDHVGGTQALAQHYQVPVVGPHKDDKFWLDGLPVQSTQFGLPHCDAFEPDEWFEGSEAVTVGEEVLQVYFTPGHTPGHVVLFSKNSGIVFVGDVLFAGSVGRTDFPGGNHQQLMESIKRQLWPMPDDTVVVPGHGPNTTIGHERDTNPYVH